MWKISLISFKQHMLIAFLLRAFLIIYSEYHDEIAEVPFTDIDYRVFTDAARHICNGKSPYDRHTYRYPPLIALILIPNVIFHGCFGKILFSIVDLIVGYLIRTIVLHSRRQYKSHKIIQQVNESENVLLSADEIANRRNEGSLRMRSTKNNTQPQPLIEENVELHQDDIVADYCMFFWIYNPMTIIISTRGNADSIAGCVVLATIYFLQCKRKYFVAGLLHGLAIHIRLYPIIYSLSYFMYLSEFGQYATDRRVTSHASPIMITNKSINISTEIVSNVDRIENKRRTIFKKEYLLYLIPNYNQLQLICGCFLSLFVSILLFYYLYGYNFLYETYIYHFIRKDTRHNFSMFFYIQYLTAGVKNIGVWQKILSVLPQMVLLLVLSVRYGLNKFTIHFSLLTQTIVIVAYNSVLTSQYFVWILAILPLTLWQFEITIRSSVVLTLIWFAAQIAWLLPAYLLEFHGQNTFLFIWVQSVSLFCANMAILGRLIKCFMYKNK